MSIDVAGHPREVMEHLIYGCGTVSEGSGTVSATLTPSPLPVPSLSGGGVRYGDGARGSWQSSHGGAKRQAGCCRDVLTDMAITNWEIY